MTRKDFELIASVIRETSEHHALDDFGEGWHAAVSAIRVRFMAALKEQNPRFNPERFERASGVVRN
jgi:hypothetical protein